MTSRNWKQDKEIENVLNSDFLQRSLHGSYFLIQWGRIYMLQLADNNENIYKTEFLVSRQYKTFR